MFLCVHVGFSFIVINRWSQLSTIHANAGIVLSLLGI